MSKAADNIISDLESVVLDEPSWKNSVETSDGQTVRLLGSLWRDSPVLQKQITDGSSYLVLDVASGTLTDLANAHHGGHIPKAYTRRLNLLAVCGVLELKQLTSKCLHSLLLSRKLVTDDIPRECSTETALQCFKILLDTPMRTADIYARQLSRIAHHCNNDKGVMTNAMNLLKQKLNKFASIGLDALPVDFDTEECFIVIHRRPGTLQSAILKGNELVNVNVLGKNFNLESLDESRNFLLKYGEYVLYPSGDSIHLKNLRDECDPIAVLNGASILLVRKNFVAAVQTEDKRDSIMLWTDALEFERIYRSDSRIRSVDFDTETRILAIMLEAGTKRFFRFANNALNSLSAEFTSQLEALWGYKHTAPKRRGESGFESYFTVNLPCAISLKGIMERKDAEQSGQPRTAAERFFFRCARLMGPSDPVEDAIRELIMTSRSVVSHKINNGSLYSVECFNVSNVKQTILNEGELKAYSWLRMSS